MQTLYIVCADISGGISEISPGKCTFVILMSVISELGKYLSIALFFSEISHFLVCLGRSEFRWVLLEMQLGYGKSEQGYYSAGALVLELPHR